jgi:hypothetical protein
MNDSSIIQTIQGFITLWGVIGYILVYSKIITPQKMCKDKKGKITYFLLGGPINWFLWAMIILIENIVKFFKR